MSRADIFQTKGNGVLQMRTSALFGAKNSGFFENYGVSARTRGLSQCRHFLDKEEPIFRDFVWTFFIDGPKSKFMIILEIKTGHSTTSA